MELFLRLLAVFVKIIYLFVYPLLGLLLPRRKHQQLPPIKNELLTQSLVFLIHELRTKKLKSETLVAAYIARIREVEPLLHAVVEPRYGAAIEEAQRADALIAKATGVVQLQALFAHYPLLGIPFTVKEACGVKGMTHIVGSLERIEERCAADGQVVSLLRAAGGIPLLVSANPEYCFSIETQAHTQSHQKCQNAYDARRTAGGSSGGEGALNGAGATPFGIGSDVAGSIRIPCLFNGIFGHKPTGGITALQGHFPSANSAYLQLGPMTRFGRDLGLLLQIMAGDKAASLNLLTPVVTKEIKIYYALGFDGLNGWLHSSVCYDMKLSIMKAARYFAQMGVVTAPAKIVGFRNSTEIAFSAIARMNDLPYLMETEQKSPLCATLWEYMRSLCGRSSYTKEGLLFELLRRAHGFMPERCLEKYEAEAKLLKEEIIQLLGSNGVLFFPTFHVPAVHHHSSVLPLWGIDYTLIFNVLGLPATHIPMGLDESGLPIGFQVIAAPLQDRLCLQIAGELELGFGGWVPPTKHEFETK